MARLALSRRPVFALLAVPAALGLTALVMGLSAPAGAAAPRVAVPRAASDDGQVQDLNVAFELGSNASMQVTETIRYDFTGTSGKHGIYREIPVKFSYDKDHNRVYPLSNITASSPTGASTELDVTRGTITTIRLGSENRPVTGVQTYVLRYDLGGVVNTVAGGQELYWNAVGTGWQVPVQHTTVTVRGPAAVGRTACHEGPKGSTERCASSVADGVATFTSGRALAPHESLTVVAGFPTGTFPGAAPILRDKWSLTRAFALTPATGIGSVAVLGLLAGGTGLLVGRRGRDRRYLDVVPGLTPGARSAGAEPRTGRVGRRPPVAVQFSPPPQVRVGELGTVIDEKADVVDVTATIIDLAVRGYLRIEEVEPGTQVEEYDEDVADRDARRATAERKAAKARRGTVVDEPKPRTADDWVLVRLDRSTDDLREYERTLYEAIFSGRRRVALSALRETFSSDLSRVRSLLYREVTERGWFAANPRRVRLTWRGYGSLVLGVGILGTIALAIFTHLALVGLAVTVAGAIMIWLGGRMPARTAAGTALLAQAQGFRLYLETAEANQIRFEEGQDVFSRYLPYAIIFGVAERWAELFATLAASGAAVAEPTWYVGTAWGPGGFNYHAFSASMISFSSQAASSLAEPTPSSSGSSGFSGGFSGGGGGGGGGGSW